MVNGLETNLNGLDFDKLDTKTQVETLAIEHNAGRDKVKKALKQDPATGNWYVDRGEESPLPKDTKNDYLKKVDILYPAIFE